MKRNLVTYSGNNEILVWTLSTTLRKGIDVVVPFSHEAVYVRDGAVEDIFTAGRYTLKRKRKYRMSDAAFYFINKTVTVTVPWGTTRQSELDDPVLKMPIKIGINGEAKIFIKDSKTFLMRVVGSLPGYTVPELQGYFLTKISTLTIDRLSKIMFANGYSYFDLDRYLSAVSLSIKSELEKDFAEYGVGLAEFMIAGTKIGDKERANYADDMEEARRLEHRGMNYAEARRQKKEDEKDERDYNIEMVKAVGQSLKKETKVFVGGAGVACPKCGKMNNGTDVFCSACGAKVIG